MKNLLISLLLLPTLLYSQKIEGSEGSYKTRIEYSVSGRDINYVFDNANSWIENEFPLRKMNDVVVYPQTKKISGVVYNKKLSFYIEIICHDGNFITKFSDFKIKNKPIKSNKIDKVNLYLFQLCGRMQNHIRYHQNGY